MMRTLLATVLMAAVGIWFGLRSVYAIPSQFVSALGTATNDGAEAVVQLPNYSNKFVATGWVDGRFHPGHDTIPLLLTQFSVDVNGYFSVDWAKKLNGPSIGDDTVATVGWDLLRIEEDHGFVVVGYTTCFGVGQVDALLTEFDANGNLQRLYTFGGNGADGAQHVLRTADGGILIAGYVSGFGGNPPGGDMYLAKFPPPSMWTDNLQPEWTYLVGSQSGKDESGVGVLEDPVDPANPFYVISGYTWDVPAGGYDILVVKLRYNSQADTMELLWKKRIGGPGREGAVSVIKTSDDAYVLGGGTTSYQINDGDVQDAVVMKLDPNTGDTLWVRALRTSGWDYCASLVEGDSGSIMVGGWVGGGAPDERYFLLSNISAQGVWQWHRFTRVSGVDMGREAALVRTQDGGYLQVGRSLLGAQGAGGYDLLVAKYDHWGNTCQEDSLSPETPEGMEVATPGLSVTPVTLQVIPHQPQPTGIGLQSTFICSSY